MAPKSRLGNGFALLLGSALIAGCGPRDENANRPPTQQAGQPKGNEADNRGKAVREPEAWPAAFTERLNAGDLDGVVALYDPDARFVSPKTGETLAGRDRIRPVLAGLIDAKTRMQSQVVKTVVSGDVAILYSDFQGTTVDPSGKTVEIRSKAIEVLRRQTDGTWRLIMGDPNGRGR